MKRIVHFLVVATILLAVLPGCVEKQGYYNAGEESVIALICDITWAGEKQIEDDGSSWQSVWDFNKNGTYSRINIEIDKDGNRKESTGSGHWSFATPNFSVLYFGGSNYWDIQELNEKHFSFYDRVGELGDPYMTREYVEFYPYNEEKD